MIVDGKKIAQEIYFDIQDRLKKDKSHPCLAVFTCNPNGETRKFLELKKRRAAENGIDVMLAELDSEIQTEKVVEVIKTATEGCEGVIVQLPFPPHIDADKLIEAIPLGMDVDAMNYLGEDTEVLPPVVGAIAEITKKHQVDFVGKKVAVVGKGRLVGKPAALWAKAQSAAEVIVLDKHSSNTAEILKEADIIISGAGVPGLIAPEKIKEGVVIFDAGTSEEGGELKGDADPLCAEKASLFTPVPGGIGPITIAVLLRNLVILSQK